MSISYHRYQTAGSVWSLLLVVWGLVIPCACQNKEVGSSTVAEKDKIKVNWIYGAYLPKDVPLQPLSGKERWDLYVRQTYITPGIYVKSALFSIRDQIRNSPEQWGQGIDGYAKRIGSRHVQFIVQNSLSAAGFAALRWEPRYDRCRCEGFWPRTRHAAVRNFVTYDKTEKGLRPQLIPYAAAFAGGAIAATWQPGNPNLSVKGYQGAISQVGVGIGVNWLAEFAPEILKVVRKSKK